MAKLGFRNTQTIYYAQYHTDIPILDSDGFETGSHTVGYDNPVLLNANVVGKGSQIAREYFGDNPNYHKVVLVDINCPIKEDTVFWIGCTPTEKEHNYAVSDINDSLHYKAIAVKKVTNNEV